MSVSFDKVRLQRQAWLLYYNRTLLDKGIITEAEHRSMLLLIKAGYPAADL